MPTAINAATAAPAPQSRQVGGNLGQDEFLKLLVAQLQNQDPMSPMNADDMAAQLAQFSSVEQLMGLRADMQSTAQMNAEIRHLLNTNLATDMIGRSVLVPGETLSVADGTAPKAEFELGAAGAHVAITVRNRAGNVVGEVKPGALPGGRHSIDLSDLDLSAGMYTVELTALNDAGEKAPAVQYAQQHVAGVQFGPGGILLMTGDGEAIPMSEVVEIL